MNLKKHIKENYGSQYKFGNEKEVSHQLVSYWCNQKWKDLRHETREKICGLLEVDIC